MSDRFVEDGRARGHSTLVGEERELELPRQPVDGKAACSGASVLARPRSS
jgi:hypothetical protein